MFTHTFKVRDLVYQAWEDENRAKSTLLFSIYFLSWSTWSDAVLSQEAPTCMVFLEYLHRWFLLNRLKDQNISETYDESGKDQSICAQDANNIFAFDDPFWKTNAHSRGLWSIIMMLIIFTCNSVLISSVKESTVRKKLPKKYAKY